MKVCHVCKELKPLERFSKNSRAKDGWNYTCKDCNNARHRIYYSSEKGKEALRDYKQRNKEKITAYNKAYLREYRSWGFKNQRKLKMCLYKSGECSHCGVKANIDNIAMFDFHHINSDEKEYTPSDLTQRKWEVIIQELDKCILLCSNCHRVEHHRQYRAKLETLKSQEGVETTKRVFKKKITE